MWADWQNWQDCTATCGNGTQSRVRTCLPSNGECPRGVTSETRECPDLGQCPKSEWAAWNTWSGCSGSCGTGQRERHRPCIIPGNSVKLCPGKHTETEPCQLPLLCPELLPVWELWGEWSLCSVTCGTGQQERHRECEGEKRIVCLGSSNETRTCDRDPCQVKQPKTWMATLNSSLVFVALHNGFDQGVVQFSDVRVVDIESGGHSRPCRKVSLTVGRMMLL